jgi:hypothetical protein
MNYASTVGYRAWWFYDEERVMDSRRGRFIAVVALALAIVAGSARAERPPMSKKEATVIVRGEVQRIFTRKVPGQVGYLVEILVDEVERGDRVKSGDVVYAFCFQNELNGMPGAKGHRAIPKERDDLRAYLFARDHGMLEGLYPEWFEPLKPAWTLGVYTQPGTLKEDRGLQITQLVSGGAAEKAGLRVGDLLVSGNFDTLENVPDLMKVLLHSKGTLEVRYIEGRTGAEKTATVSLTPISEKSPAAAPE